MKKVVLKFKKNLLSGLELGNGDYELIKDDAKGKLARGSAEFHTAILGIDMAKEVAKLAERRERDLAKIGCLYFGILIFTASLELYHKNQFIKQAIGNNNFNLYRFIDKFVPRKYRKIEKQTIKGLSKKDKKDYIKKLLEETIKFQNLQDCKRAFRFGLNIDIIRELGSRKFIWDQLIYCQKLRHLLSHSARFVAPMLGFNKRGKEITLEREHIDYFADAHHFYLLALDQRLGYWKKIS